MYPFDGNNDSIFFSKIDKRFKLLTKFFHFLREYLSVNDSNLFFIKLNVF